MKKFADLSLISFLLILSLFLLSDGWMTLTRELPPIWVRPGYEVRRFSDRVEGVIASVEHGGILVKFKDGSESLCKPIDVQPIFRSPCRVEEKTTTNP